MNGADSAVPSAGRLGASGDRGDANGTPATAGLGGIATGIVSQPEASSGTTGIISGWARSTRQTPTEMKESYGLGWAVGGDGYGHGGAWATNLWVNPSAGRVYVWMVQHNGFPADGGQAQGAFRRAADATFPPAKR